MEWHVSLNLQREIDKSFCYQLVVNPYLSGKTYWQIAGWFPD